MEMPDRAAFRGIDVERAPHDMPKSHAMYARDLVLSPSLRCSAESERHQHCILVCSSEARIAQSKTSLVGWRSHALLHLCIGGWDWDNKLGKCESITIAEHRSLWSVTGQLLLR